MLKRFGSSIVFALAAMFVAASAMLAPMQANAASMSDYLENKIADHIFRNTAFTAPTTLAFALYTSACSDSAGGTEVSGGSYARATLNPSTTNWNGTHGNTTGASSGTGGTVSNAAVITFATPSAGWGTVTHVGVLDATSAGNLLFCVALTTSKTINSGDTVTFPATTFTMQIDN
jgi:hypothetical protein